MATAVQSRGRGPYVFARKFYNHYLLQSQKLNFSVAHSSYLSAAFLLGDARNGERRGADSVGVSQHGCTRTPRRAFIHARSGRYDRVALNEDPSPADKTWARSTESSLPRCRGFAESRRSFGACVQRLERCGSRRGPGAGRSASVRAFADTGARARTEPLYKTKSGYYELLEVPRDATQAQIKTAYYRQSFVYHPDRNDGSEAAGVRFSEITEAYAVLGNEALRKKYNRGLLLSSDLVASGDSTGGPAGPRSGEGRRSAGDAFGRGAVFDYDNFIKDFYSHQVERDRLLRTRMEKLRKEREKEEADKSKPGGLLEWTLATAMLGTFLAILYSFRQ